MIMNSCYNVVSLSRYSQLITIYSKCVWTFAIISKQEIIIWNLNIFVIRAVYIQDYKYIQILSKGFYIASAHSVYNHDSCITVQEAHQSEDDKRSSVQLLEEQNGIIVYITFLQCDLQYWEYQLYCQNNHRPVWPELHWAHILIKYNLYTIKMFC